MYLKRLELENFRNYEKQEINLINGINLFLGRNAQGKTNIIEALYVCSFGKSYRTTKDNELIMFNKPYCKINLDYLKGDINSNTSFYIDNLNRKQIKNNEVKVKKIADYVGEIPVVIFSPESLDIVKGSPAKRRNFVDMICCQLSKSYIICHHEYMKCFKMKNTMLKQDVIDEGYIEVLHEKMSGYIKKIVETRLKVIEKIEQYAKSIQKKLTNGAEDIVLNYKSDFIGMNENEIKKYLDDHLYIDKLRKSCVKGIQRDDIEILVDSNEVAVYGSQGQKRTSLLTLKLANFELLKDVKGENPILLLDDIMSELDGVRTNFLLEYIENYQSIITTTEDTFVKDIQNIKYFNVESGNVKE